MIARWADNSIVSDRGPEWISALIMTGWGIALALPPEVMTGANWFTRSGSEASWAVIFGFVGGSRCTALLIASLRAAGGVAVPFVRMLGSLFGAIVWGQIAYLVGLRHTSPEAVTYTVIAVSDLFSIFRAAYDARRFGR